LKEKPKEDNQYILSDEEAKMVGKIMRRRIDTFNPHRRILLLEIKANISYLVGQQNIQLVGDHICPLERERVIESTANVILPAVQNDISVATRMPPVYDIVPVGTDADDKATAIAGQKILKFVQRRIGKDLKRGETVLWYDISGVGWRKVYWDSNYTVLGINPEPGNPGHIPDIEVGEAITEGEVIVETVPTNQLIYDYRESDLRKLPWIIHAKRVSAQYVVDRFGVDVYNKLSSKFSANQADGETQFEASISNTFSTTFTGVSDDDVKMITHKMPDNSEIKLDSDKNIDYYEYWAKPTKSSPTGTFAIMLGDQVVAHSPYPRDMYPHGELPFTPAAPLCIAQATSGAISRISQARPLQREYNRLRSQVAENIDVMGNAVIFAPRQAKLRHKTLDNGAGNIIEYDGPVGKPTREPGVPMNGQVFVYLQETKLAIDEIFAFHDPSKGIAPKNIESGKGLLALQSADISHLGPIVSEFEASDEKVAYQILTVALANYPDKKKINVVGNDYEWTLYELDKEQLKGKFNVAVKQHSSMPLDKDKESLLAFEMWQSGLLGDPNDPELRVWTLDQMHTGNVDVLLQKNSKHKNFARKEFAVATDNLKKIDMPEGLPKEALAEVINQYLFIPHINLFDDHIIHIKDHSEYLLDNYWQFRSTGNPLYIELLERMTIHLQEHQIVVAEIQQRQHDQALRDEMLIKGKTPEQLLLAQATNFQNNKGKEKKDGKRS
jgi:hypothetical protein